MKNPLIILIVLILIVGAGYLSDLAFGQPITPSGTLYFLYLHDTPSSFTANYGLRANSAGDALEFYDISATTAFDSTTVDNTTWSDNANSTNIWTFDVSGTDHTMTAGNNFMRFSGDLTSTGDLTVTGGDITLGTSSIFSGGDTASLNNIDALNATTEATIESAIDTLSNLTSIGTIATGTWQATDVGVAYGGTGASTLTDGGVLLGSGTNAITAMSVLANGTIIIGDGTTDPTSLAAFTGSAGTLKHESGGLEADVSGYTNGIYGMASGATLDIDTIAEIETAIGGTNIIISTEIDTFSELNTLVSDKTLVNEEDAVTWDALGTFGLGVTITTGDPFTLGTNRIDNGSDLIDGEQIANDTIDNDSIDWGDMTDLTTDGAISWGNIAEGELANSSVISADIKDDTIDSADYAAGSIDYEHLADDVISGAAAVGTFESGDTFLVLEAGVGLREVDYDDLPGAAGVTAWDDIADPDNSGLTTITFDNAELSLFTGDNDAAASFFTIQNSDADHTGGNLYLLDLDYSADDGDVDADFIKCQDSGGVVFSIQEDGNTVISGTLNVTLNSTFAAPITLDDGVGNSPSFTIMDGDDNYFEINKKDTGETYLLNNEGAIQIKPSGDLDDFLSISTTTGIVTITTVANDDGDLVITAGGGDISFGDENLSTTGTFDAGLTTITGSLTVTGSVTVSDILEAAILTEGGIAVYNDDEMDTLSEITSILTDVTAIITDDDMPAAGTDPDLDAAGEIGRDTDGADETGDSSLRGHDGSNQFLYSKKLKTLNFTLIEPDQIDAYDLIPVWNNTSGMTFTITEWKGWSDDDDVSFEIEELTDLTDFTSITLVVACEVATDGTSVYYGGSTTITHATIEHDHSLAIDFDGASDTPDYVQIAITGWFNADVN